jgi:hypothetical protein
MEKVNHADSISVTFTDGLFGFTVIGDYDLNTQ